MILSRITHDMLATFPPEVLHALDLGPEDGASFAIEHGEVRLLKTTGPEKDAGLSTEQLRRLLEEGMQGPTIPLDQAFDEVERHLEARRAAGAA